MLRLLREVRILAALMLGAYLIVLVRPLVIVEGMLALIGLVLVLGLMQTLAMPLVVGVRQLGTLAAVGIRIVITALRPTPEGCSVTNKG